jgi:hypothetical protein
MTTQTIAPASTIIPAPGLITTAAFGNNLILAVCKEIEVDYSFPAATDLIAAYGQGPGGTVVVNVNDLWRKTVVNLREVDCTINGVTIYSSRSAGVPRATDLFLLWTNVTAGSESYLVFSYDLQASANKATRLTDNVKDDWISIDGKDPIK